MSYLPYQHRADACGRNDARFYDTIAWILENVGQYEGGNKTIREFRESFLQAGGIMKTEEPSWSAKVKLNKTRFCFKEPSIAMRVRLMWA